MNNQDVSAALKIIQESLKDISFSKCSIKEIEHTMDLANQLGIRKLVSKCNREINKRENKSLKQKASLDFKLSKTPFTLEDIIIGNYVATNRTRLVSNNREISIDLVSLKMDNLSRETMLKNAINILRNDEIEVITVTTGKLYFIRTETKDEIIKKYGDLICFSGNRIAPIRSWDLQLKLNIIPNAPSMYLADCSVRYRLADTRKIGTRKISGIDVYETDNNH